MHRFNLHRNEKLEKFVLDLKTNLPEFLLLGLWKMYSVCITFIFFSLAGLAGKGLGGRQNVEL